FWAPHQSGEVLTIMHHKDASSSPSTTSSRRAATTVVMTSSAPRRKQIPDLNRKFCQRRSSRIDLQVRQSEMKSLRTEPNRKNGEQAQVGRSRFRRCTEALISP